MLSEDSLNILMQPIITRQENINLYVLKIIVERIKEIGTLLPSDLHTLQQLVRTGSDIKKINDYLATQTNLQSKDIKDLIKTVALDAYIDAKPFYLAKGKDFISFAENTYLNQIVTAIAEQTADTYINMSKAQAFMLRDLANPKVLIPTPIAKAYQTIVDEAIQASQSGVLDYNTAMRRSLNQLINSGIRNVNYEAESGRRHTQRLDTAVRRNLLDGIRAINLGVQKEVGRQFGADGVEISVHEMSAPDHEPVQGHQFTNEEYNKLQNGEAFTDVNGEHFKPIERAIGTLNCRHFAWSIVIGVSKPLYTQAQLNEFIKKNNEGYTMTNGKHLTMYECTQEQRRLETEIRRAKDGQIVAKEAGDIDLAKKYQAKVSKLIKDYNAFSKACGLKKRFESIRVEGYEKL